MKEKEQNQHYKTWKRTNLESLFDKFCEQNELIDGILKGDFKKFCDEEYQEYCDRLEDDLNDNYDYEKYSKEDYYVDVDEGGEDD